MTSIAPGPGLDLVGTLHEVVKLFSAEVTSEAEIFHHVVVALRKLGLRGSISTLDADGVTLRIRAHADSHPIFARVERLTGLSTRGFTFDASRVDAYRTVLRGGEVVYVADAREVVAQLVPAVARPFLTMIQSITQGTAAIFAPLRRAGLVVGVLNVSGPTITEAELPTLQGFAAGISMALENVQLYHQKRHDDAARETVNSLLVSALRGAPLETTLESALESLVRRSGQIRQATITLFGRDDEPTRTFQFGDLPAGASAACGAPQQLDHWRAADRASCARCPCGACGFHGSTVALISDHDHLYGVLCGKPTDGPQRDLAPLLQPTANALGAVIARHSAEAARDQAQARFLHAQRLEAVGRLAGGVAHDMNNMLMAINMTLSLIKEELPEGSEARGDLDEVELICDRGARLTRQLLMFSRRQTLSPQPLVLSALLGQMEKMLARLLGEDITLTLDARDDGWTVLADEGAIEQLVMNLVVNARDAMPTGGRLTLRVTRHTGLVPPASAPHLAHRAPSEWVCLEVQDTGTGIDEATRARMFEPFFTSKGPERGTGLGLAVVHGVVTESHGWIDVDSTPGCGATFKVWLPKSKPATDASAEEANAPRPLMTDARVLVLEDDPILARFLERTLTGAGLRPSLCTTVADARRVVRERLAELDLVVADVILPDGNGVLFAQELQHQRPSLPVLLMSGYFDERSRAHEIQSRGYSFMPKPFKAEALLARIEALLRSRASAPPALSP